MAAPGEVARQLGLSTNPEKERGQFDYQEGYARGETCFDYVEKMGIDPKTKEPTPVRKYCCCCFDAREGNACCLYNIIFSPIVLCYHAIRIYCCSCLGIHLKRSFHRFCCFCCHACDWTCRCFGIIWTCCAWSYVDHKFPPCPSSLGNVGGDSAAQGQAATIHEKVVWLRAGEFGKSKVAGGGGKSEKPKRPSMTKRLYQSLIQGKLTDSNMQLYQDGISATDILQGQIGDCWLMAAMACMAERPGAIDNLFLTKELDPRGKYKIQLFDGTADGCRGQWRVFTIDDYIPCDRDAWERSGVAKPKFAQPNGEELWVLLLEKAFAKLCGSYQNLEGGSTIWALRAMTGDHCRWYSKEKSGGTRWKRWDFVNQEDPSKHPVCRHCLRPVARDKRNGSLQGTDETLSVDEMWDTLFRYNRRGSVLCASGAQRMDGLVSGHAYSILDAQEFKESSRTGPCHLKLVRIRNPWGGGEWKGDWGDNSAKWEEFPAVKAKIHVAKDDGSFWMCWDDYCDYWDRLGIADRTRNIHSLHLEYNQTYKLTGPTRGLFYGCYEYWCCLLGCRRLYCPKQSSKENVAFDGKHHPNCCGCTRSSIADRI
ncbi:unnamed protein product [Amoebophrya sp. A120]|nr:unnamed protein product [Amoebophrya sp. A120]|eukprot:GSA120T00014608001.1